MRPSAVLAFVAVATAAPLAAQDSSAFALTIPNIMRGPEVVGRMPEHVQWSPDSQWIYFEWLPPGSDWRDPLAPYRVRAVAGATPERLTDAQADSLGPLVATGTLSHDGRLRAVEYDGDIYVVDLRTQTARRLTNTEAREADPQFNVGDARVFFTRDDNVFAVSLKDGLEQQLTDLRPGPAPKEDSANTGQRKTLEGDQKRLFQVIRDEYRADSIAKARQSRAEGIRGKPLYLLHDERVADLAVSPNGKAVLLITRINSERSRSTEVPKWVTKSGYVEDLRGRDKVGDTQDSGRVALVSLPSGNARWLHPIPGDTIANPGLVRMLGWSDDGSHALLFTVSANYKARYIETVTEDAGAIDTIDVLRDTAWIEGPCFSAAAGSMAASASGSSPRPTGTRTSTPSTPTARKRAAHERQVGSARCGALARQEVVLSAHERGVAVRAAVLSHARHRRRARRGSRRRKRRTHRDRVAERTAPRRRVLRRPIGRPSCS